MFDCDKGRQTIYVSVADVNNTPFIKFDEVQERSLKVTTHRSLVKIDVAEVNLCKELRTVQNNQHRTVFQNIYGDKFNFTEAYTKQDGTHVTAYFSHSSSNATKHDSPAVSVAHETAVQHAAQLVEKNNLCVVKLCDHPSHTRTADYVALKTSWLPIECAPKCVEAMHVNCDDEKTTEIGYRWEPRDGEVFVIDLVHTLQNSTLCAFDDEHIGAFARRLY